VAGATVEQLWRAVFPAAQSVGDPAGLQRTVAWIRVLKPRTPGFDALEKDDLAIVPVPALASLSALAIDPAYVIEAVTAAGGCGVLLVGDAAGAAARTVLRAAGERRLAALALADADVNALERSAIGFVVNARAELESRAAALELELERAASGGAGAERLAAVVSTFFARPVAIEADDGTVLAVHAGAESAGAGPQLSAYLRQRRGAALRVALPTAGALVLLGSAPVSDLERVATARVAPFLALSLAAPAGATDSRHGRNERLPAEGPPWVALVARQGAADQLPGLSERETARAAIRRLEPARRLQLRGDADSLELRLVFAPPATDRHGAGLAGRVSRVLRRPVAISEAFAAPVDRAAREASAQVTIEAFEALPPAERRRLAGPDGATVLRAELLPALRLLAGLSAMPDAPRHARALLDPLMTGRRARDVHSLATLRAVLDYPGMAEAAAALGIHRNTLAYRLAAIERRTGWSMSDPLVRFGLALAVRFVQTDQEAAG
jgi:PucR-like helix-turn-helix protein